jgi:hypothetical protein
MIRVSPDHQEGRAAARSYEDISACRPELDILIHKDLDVSGTSRGQSYSQTHEGYPSLQART